MTVNKLDTLDERIQKPAYLLLLVVVLLFLIVGFVDLIDTTSNNPAIFGRYSLKYFAVVMAYLLLTLAWASLLLRPNNDRWLTKSLDFIQRIPLLAIAILAGILIVFALMLSPQQRVHNLLLEFPALQATIFVNLLLAAALILFYKWGDESRPQLWRKLVVGLLVLLLIVELIIQLFAFFGLLPSLTSTRDSFAPYSRVYQNEEGLGNGITNSYGRYTTDFKLLPDSYRVAIIGDTFIQALQVSKDENLGVKLEEHLASDSEDEQAVEVLTLGYPDYGPGMYLSNWMLAVVAREFEPDEAIIFFDLGSDFQEVDGAGYGLPYFRYTGQGQVQLDLEHFFTDLHNAEHVVFYGHEGFQLVRIIGSQYLTPRFVTQILAAPQASAAQTRANPANDDIDLPNGFVFNEETDGKARLIASSQINMANLQLGRGDIAAKLVTIPAFTEAFYSQDSWNSEFGDSDLLLPERELRTVARNYGIPFLGLGTLMSVSGLTPEEVQNLYYEDGSGHFTPEGHAFAADAVYQCFFAKTLSAAEGCDLP